MSWGDWHRLISASLLPPTGRLCERLQEHLITHFAGVVYFVVNEQLTFWRHKSLRSETERLLRRSHLGRTTTEDEKYLYRVGVAYFFMFFNSSMFPQT